MLSWHPVWDLNCQPSNQWVVSHPTTNHAEHSLTSLIKVPPRLGFEPLTFHFELYDKHWRWKAACRPAASCAAGKNLLICKVGEHQWLPFGAIILVSIEQEMGSLFRSLPYSRSHRTSGGTNLGRRLRRIVQNAFPEQKREKKFCGDGTAAKLSFLSPSPFT